MRLLITGGAGFIGSHLAEWLLAAGHEVVVLDNLATGRRHNLAGLVGRSGFRFVEGDCGQADLLESLLGQVERVFHLAAAVGVELVARDPLTTVETNIGPTARLLAAARRQWELGRPMSVFLASTSEVYGKNPHLPWSEQADLLFGPTTRPRWSYGLSKAIDEVLALATHTACGLPVVVGRFFNVVGPRQVGSYGMVLPRLAEAALTGQPMTIHGDGQQTRCFAHVGDVVRAVAALMDTPQANGSIVNIGSDEPITILDLAHRVAACAGVPARVEFVSYSQAYGSDFEDVRHRVPDLTRLRQLVPSPFTYDLDATIRAVIADRREGLTGTSG